MLMALQQVSAGSSLRKVNIHQHEKDRKLDVNVLIVMKETLEGCIDGKTKCLQVIQDISFEGGKQNVTKCIYDSDSDNFVAYDDEIVDDVFKIHTDDDGVLEKDGEKDGSN